MKQYVAQINYYGIYIGGDPWNVALPMISSFMAMKSNKLFVHGSFGTAVHGSVQKLIQICLDPSSELGLGAFIDIISNTTTQRATY